MKILVMDDEKGIREVMVEFLNHEGYEVVSVENAQEGLKKLSDGFDLLITDNDITGLDSAGTKFVSKIRDMFPNVPIIMMSGRASVIEKPPAVDILIAKPFKFADVKAAIDKAIKMHQSDVLQ